MVQGPQHPPGQHESPAAAGSAPRAFRVPDTLAPSSTGSRSIPFPQVLQKVPATLAELQETMAAGAGPLAPKLQKSQP